VFFRKELAVANVPSMLAYLPMGALAAARLSGSFDVINTHFVVPTGPLGAWLARRRGIPNVLSVHGGDLYDPSKKLSPHRISWLKRPIRGLLLGADALVGQSRNTLQNVVDIYDVHRDSQLIPLGIDRPPAVRGDRAQFGLPAGAFVMVTVGRLEPPASRRAYTCWAR
jgi:Glycosyltransferase Family 4